MRDAGGWTRAAEPDLIADDLIGDVSLLIECGLPQKMKRLVKALGRYKEARIIALFADDEGAPVLRKELSSARARNLDKLEIYRVSGELMAGLERMGSRNMVWSATINEGQLYLDCDGQQLEGRLEAL